MNRTLRWLYRTKLSKEDFLKCLSSKRKQQLDKDYRKYLKRRGTLDLSLITKYLDEKEIPYTMESPQLDEELFDDETNDDTYMWPDPVGEGIVLYLEDVKIRIYNVVYSKGYYSIRTFSFTQIGEYARCNYWIEEDVINLLQHLPPILKEWNGDEFFIDREFRKRDKIVKLNAVRDKILQLHSKTKNNQTGLSRQ